MKISESYTLYEILVWEHDGDPYASLIDRFPSLKDAEEAADEKKLKEYEIICLYQYSL